MTSTVAAGAQGAPPQNQPQGAPAGLPAGGITPAVGVGGAPQGTEPKGPTPIDLDPNQVYRLGGNDGKVLKYSELAESVLDTPAIKQQAGRLQQEIEFERSNYNLQLAQMQQQLEEYEYLKGLVLGDDMLYAYVNARGENLPVEEARQRAFAAAKVTPGAPQRQQVQAQPAPELGTPEWQQWFENKLADEREQSKRDMMEIVQNTVGSSLRGLAPQISGIQQRFQQADQQQQAVQEWEYNSTRNAGLMDSSITRELAKVGTSWGSLNPQEQAAVDAAFLDSLAQKGIHLSGDTIGSGQLDAGYASFAAEAAVRALFNANKPFVPQPSIQPSGIGSPAPGGNSNQLRRPMPVSISERMRSKAIS